MKKKISVREMENIASERTERTETNSLDEK